MGLTEKIKLRSISKKHLTFEVKAEAGAGGGVSAGGGDAKFMFYQEEPTDIWVINHNLGKMPSVSQFTDNFVAFQGVVKHIDTGNLEIYHSEPVNGYAFLN